MKAYTKEAQAKMTPDSSIEALKNGNKRFLKSFKAERNFIRASKRR